ncbi:MAG: pyridoxal phosphate-dependent aminotransferase [Pseudarthrobacter sp.]
MKVGIPTYSHEIFDLPPERVRQLVQVAARHDLTILADDIYDMFLYDGAKHLTPAAVAEGRNRTLTLNALSKAYSMTGWRVGWVAGPAHLMAKVRRLKAISSGGTSIISQHAGLAALTGPQDCIQQFLAEYTERRRYVLNTVNQLGWPVGRPTGGQFVFADITGTGKDSLELAEEVLEKEHVLVYPGAAFAAGCEYFVRITFLQPMPILKEGLDRILRALGT